MQNELAMFEDHAIRRVYDEKTETWFFSVVDVVQILIQQPDFQTARKYWNKLKERLKKEGSLADLFNWRAQPIGNVNGYQAQKLNLSS